MLFGNQGFCFQVTLRWINTYDLFFNKERYEKAFQAENTVAVTNPILMSKSRIMWFCVTKWKICMCNTILNACICCWHNFCSKYWTWSAMDFFSIEAKIIYGIIRCSVRYCCKFNLQQTKSDQDIIYCNGETQIHILCINLCLYQWFLGIGL